MKIKDIVNDSEILYTSDEIKVSISNIADARLTNILEI